MLIWGAAQVLQSRVVGPGGDEAADGIGPAGGSVRLRLCCPRGG